MLTRANATFVIIWHCFQKGGGNIQCAVCGARTLRILFTNLEHKLFRQKSAVVWLSCFVLFFSGRERSVYVL